MKILFLSLSRSGVHPIINWIAQHLDGSTIHYNNCFFSEDFKTINPKDKEIVKYKSFKKPSNFFWNHESFDPKEIEGFSLDGYDKIYLVMRDSYNWLASFYKWKPNLSNRFQQEFIPKKPKCIKNSMIQIWKNQAKESLKKTNYCKFNFKLIKYNQWVKDKNYRRNLIESLGLKFTDVGYNQVPNFANGSSFDQLKFNNRANKMNVFNRWKEFSQDQFFTKLFNDEELINLNKILFNFNYPF